jgi:hypothetical protein
MKNLKSVISVFSILSATLVGSEISQAQTINLEQTTPKNVIKAGTAIRLRLLDEVSSKTARVGERIRLELMEDIKLAGKTIIPLGTPAYGEVTKVDQKGMFGKSGKVGTRLVAIKFNDQEIRITGSLDGAGEGGTAATIGAVAVIPVAGFFVTGKSALLSPGLQTNGFLESDLVVK